MSSKSGTNDFHGSAYEYFRNTVLNANSFFANANGTGKQPFKQNQYGLTGGGPILKNKMFFFAAWEGFRSRQGSNYTATVPLPEMYRGDFSGYRNASNAVIPVYDPLTQCGTRNNNACAPGQVFSARNSPEMSFPPAGSTPSPQSSLASRSWRSRTCRDSRSPIISTSVRSLLKAAITTKSTVVGTTA